MNPIGALITAVLAVVVFGGSRRWAATAIILGVCYLTQGVALNIGFNFTAIRLILLSGFLRVIVRGELRVIRFNAIDKALVIYGIGQFIIPVIRVGTFGELVYQLGNLYNVYLSYFVFRGLLRDEDELFSLLELTAILLIPLVLIMTFEATTGRNIFSIFSGVGQYSMFRDGHFRANGPFRSPITAGSFGATFALFYSSMIFSRGVSRAAVLGLGLSLAIAIPWARSSGPVLGLMLGIGAMACWPVRMHTRKMRWGIVIALFSLHMVMKSPVWFLLGRISDLVGGGGYHRAYIIDNFVKNFWAWCFMGMNDTADWVATQLESGGADITNQFVADGLNGGIIGLILSITVIVRTFQAVGKAMRATHEDDLASTKFVWGLGSNVVGNIGILFSVTYFDQMQVIWYLLIACIASITSNMTKKMLKTDVFEEQGTVN